MNEKPYQNLFTHIMFWALFLVIKTLFLGSHTGNYGEIFVATLIDLPVYILTTYFFISFLIPKYIYKGKYYLFAIVFVLSCCIPVFIKWATDYYFKYPVYFNKDISISHFCIYTFSSDFINIYFVVALAISLLFVKNWYVKQKENQLLVQKHKEAELSLIKAQLNPHFLFNTLNNLYALATKKSAEVPGVIMQVSDLLNYVLYECDTKWVSLKKEIAFLKNYIELEKLRFGSRLSCELNIELEKDEYYIAPMVLISFVENCFKHGVSNVRQNPFVNINVMVKNNTLYFSSENSLSNKMKEKELDYQQGIGIKNTKKRLEYIYHDNYTLEIDDSEQVYKVSLKIPVHNEETI